MMKPIDFHPEAAEEARQAAAYYENISGGLAADFHSELAKALERIRDNPRMYAAESGDVRLCPLHRFPYSVFYEELADRLWVAAVGHHRRRPGYWARRHPS